MARFGIRTKLFDHLSIAKLNSNWLLLGTSNARPVAEFDRLTYYRGVDTVVWCIDPRQHYYEVKHKHRTFYKYTKQHPLNPSMAEVKIATPYFSYGGHFRTGYLQMEYLGSLRINIVRMSESASIIVGVSSGDFSFTHRILPVQIKLDSLYKYCYNLMVLINGGPLEI